MRPGPARLLARHWFLASLAFGLALTLGLPHLFHPVTDHFEPRLTIAASLLLMAWTMPGRSLADEARRPWAALWAVAVSYGGAPPLAWLLGRLPVPGDLRVGLFVVSAGPCTLASAVLWTRLAGGNEATALLAVLGSTLTSWLATTAWLAGGTGLAVDLDPGPLMRDLVLCLVLPVLAGQLLRLPAPAARFADRHKHPLGALAQLCVLAIILKAGVTVGLRLREGAADLDGAFVAASVTLAAALHLLTLAFGLSTSRLLGFDRARQSAVAIACSQKTLPVSLLLFERYFKDSFPLAVLPILFFHVGQLLLDTVIAHRLARSGTRGTTEAKEFSEPQRGGSQ